MKEKFPDSLVRNQRIDLSTYVKMDFAQIAPLLQTTYALPDFSVLPDAESQKNARHQWYVDNKEIVQGCTLLFIREVWDFVKQSPQFTSLSTISSNQAREKAIQKYGESARTVDDFTAFKISTSLTLKEGVIRWGRKVDEEVDNIDSIDKDPRLITYMWLTEVAQEIKKDGLLNPADIIKRGLGTGVETIWNIFDVAPKVDEAQRNNRRIPQKNNKIDVKRIVYDLARGHQEVSISMMTALCNLRSGANEFDEATARFDPSYFHIEEINNKRTLTITQEALDVLTDPYNPQMKISDMAVASGTTGCPALYTSIIQELFELSNRLYRKLDFPVISGTDKY